MDVKLYDRVLLRYTAGNLDVKSYGTVVGKGDYCTDHDGWYSGDVAFRPDDTNFVPAIWLGKFNLKPDEVLISSSYLTRITDEDTETLPEIEVTEFMEILLSER